MNKKRLYLVSLISVFFLSLLAISGLYITFFNEILLSVQNFQKIIIGFIATVLKIVVVCLCGFFLMYKWFNQEDLFLSDLPFLTGLFFLILIPAKFLDLLMGLINEHIDANFFLFIVKVRYIIMILNLIPIIFLSVGMVLFYLSLNDKFEFLRDNTIQIKIQRLLIICIALIELIAIILAPNLISVINIYPFIAFPSLIVIIWIFAFAFKQNKLSQINPSLVSVGFLIFLLTSIFRSLGQYFLDQIIHITMSEILETITILVIFIGFAKKK